MHATAAAAESTSEAPRTNQRHKFSPVTPELRDALDRLIFCAWLLRRYAAVKAAVFQHGFELVVEHGYKPTLGEAFSTTGQQLVRLRRIINSTQRGGAARASTGARPPRPGIQETP